MMIYLYSEEENYRGYPMSEFMRNKIELSYTAREMACHALEAYAQKLRKGANNLKVLILCHFLILWKSYVANH